MKKAIYKVPNGKLLKVFLEEKHRHIASIKITGDFFMYPEEHIEFLEDKLVGSSIEKNELTAAIEAFLETYPTVFFGFDTESLVTTILNAI